MLRITLMVGTIVLTMLAIITVRNEDRLLFSRWAALQAEGDQLNVRWGRLLLEQGAFAAHERVGQIARHSLGMILPGAKQTVLVYTGSPIAPVSGTSQGRVR